METKRFQKRVEDFICEQCGVAVAGAGYRNHCPECLTSKHVDVHPGDRAAACGGPMPVVDIHQKGEQLILVQKCVVCGHLRRNKVQADDNMETIAVRMKDIADTKDDGY